MRRPTQPHFICWSHSRGEDSESGGYVLEGPSSYSSESVTDAEGAAEWYARYFWESCVEAPQTLDVNVLDPHGITTFWTVEPEYSVAYYARARKP